MCRLFWNCFLVIGVFGSFVLSSASAAAGEDVQREKRDMAAIGDRKVVAAGATVEKLAGGFRCWIPRDESRGEWDRDGPPVEPGAKYFMN